MNFSYESALTLLKQRHANDRTEEDVKAEIVEPVLHHTLGYESESIRRESQLKYKRPDYLCLRTDKKLDVIVEAKALGVNLDLRPSRSAPATRIPKIQLEEYLRKRPDSTHGVFGLLTNGEEWRVCRRIEQDVVWLSSEVAPSSPALLKALQPLLSRSTLPTQSHEFSTDRGQALLETILSSKNHRNLIEQLALEGYQPQHQTELLSAIQLAQASMFTDDLFNERYFVTIGSLGQDGILSVADVYHALRETYLIHTAIAVGGVAIAYQAPNKSVTACRVFFWDGTSLHTSNSFNPELPGTRVLRQLESLARWRDGELNNLIDQLNARTVHAQFYDEIAEWFERTGTEINDLRHLVRILFTWFLKEHGVIPLELFEKHPGIQIHQQMEHLFTHTLSMESSRRRVPKQLQLLREAFFEAPFLNGSLFSDDRGLLRNEISDADYIRAGESQNGLFTILKRYDWTLTEHDEMHSDTALDPSMIGSVFERFLAIAENIEPGPLARQPDGTYYTPKDLTDEMVCDALAFDLARNVNGVEYRDALNLLHPSEEDATTTTQLFHSPIRNKVIQRLRKITVLDPCTGSGEFIVSVMNAMRRAERRLLREEYDDIARVDSAIGHQLFAVDIHPMAIQVTRFRFYLAMIGTQLALRPNLPLGPFPNLETRFASANSLATRVVEQEHELEGVHLDSEDMRDWQIVRDSYTHAHSPIDKKLVREKEAATRSKLIRGLPWGLPHVIEWLKKETLGSENIVSQCGLPLLFGRDSWDIVIGNPPYQRPSREEKNIAGEYGYTTANCGDLYCLFVELGIKLLGEGGGLTMVVPHSICFASQKKKLRDLCSGEAESIYLRTYNNRPTAVFPPHPFIKGGNRGAENVQRVTVASVQVQHVSNKTAASVYASSYIGLEKQSRRKILRHRPSYLQPQNDQWTMAGSEALSKLLIAMKNTSSRNRITGNTREVTFPPSAGYFLTSLPVDVLDSERRKKIGVLNDQYFWPHICLFNSTVFHAYWLMVGDAFDVLHSLFESVRFPPAWIANRSLCADARAVGKEFCSAEVLNRSRSVLMRRGKSFPNFNFQDNAPELVQRADRVCIKGYQLEQDETVLLDQIQKLRQFRTWDF